MGENNSVDWALHIKCPECGSEKYSVIGLKGAVTKSLVGFGQKKGEKPLQIKCVDCKNKYMVTYEVASNDELLEKPATIKITREKKAWGMAVPFYVNINGRNVAAIGNGETIEVPVLTKVNVISALNLNGLQTTKEQYEVTLGEGETKEISFAAKIKLF